jgi:uncharacterized protein (DUF1330 family)
MPAHLFADVEVTNAAKDGAGVSVRDDTTKLEDDPEPKIIFIVEFSITVAFDHWWNSPEYQAILPSRRENSTGRLQDAVADCGWVRSPARSSNSICQDPTSAE